MLTITQDQALQRWDTLPDILREALCSEANSDFLWKACEKENVPGEKAYDIARIVGYVLLGFMHPGDMAEELKEELSIDPKTCTAVSNALDARIFAPIRPDIDKTYQPLSKFEMGPKIIQDIGPTPIMPATITSFVAVSAPKIVPPPAVPAPKPFESGWSKLTPNAPVVKLSQTSSPPPTPTTPVNAAPMISKASSAGPKGSVDEFERMGKQQAPVILHEDTSFKPQQKVPDFRIPTQTERIDLQKNAGQPAVKAAVLELGNTAPPSAPKPTSTPRVVHYTEYKSPSPETPITPKTAPAPTGPRQVTEITSQNVPPPPPLPPQNKIIYKDYSEPSLPKPPSPPPPAPLPPSPPSPPPPPLPPKL